MKRINKILCAAFVVALAASCEKTPQVVDFPIQGDLNISGKYVNYLHGTQGWIAEDKVGVFVTSDGVEQANLQYVPSEICEASPNQYVDGYFSYEEENYKAEEVALTAVGDKAGFKQGSHNIYAYVPYAEGNASYSAVKLPKLDVQKQIPYVGTYFIDLNYLFAYAKTAAPVEEMTSANISLGEFTSPYVQMTLPSMTFPAACEGKTITKIKISAAVDIATVESTIDLSTGEISGTKSKTIEIDLGEEGIAIAKDFFGTIGSSGTAYAVILMDFETGLNTDFTITCTVGETEYVATGKPAAAPFSGDGNLNMYGTISFE